MMHQSNIEAFHTYNYKQSSNCKVHGKKYKVSTPTKALEHLQYL